MLVKELIDKLNQIPGNYEVKTISETGELSIPEADDIYIDNINSQIII